MEDAARKQIVIVENVGVGADQNIRKLQKNGVTRQKLAQTASVM